MTDLVVYPTGEVVQIAFDDLWSGRSIRSELDLDHIARLTHVLDLACEGALRIAEAMEQQGVEVAGDLDVAAS